MTPSNKDISGFREILLKIPFARIIQIVFNKSAREKLEQMMDQAGKEGVPFWNRKAWREWFQDHRSDLKQALKSSGIDVVRHAKGCKCKERNKHV